MAELDDSPFRDDLKAELAVQPKRPPSKLTLALAAGVVLVAGVVIGIQADKALGGDETPAAAQRQGQGQFPQGYGRGGNGQPPQGNGQPGQRDGQQRGPGQMGGATMGTVEKVEDGTVYLKSMDGSTITVTTTGETTVQIAKPGKVTDLKAGTTVVVRGERGEDGSVSAVSISQGGAGR